MQTEQYEVIDYFSAHGPYRGLLVANQSRHVVQVAPALPEEPRIRDWVVSDAITDHVLAALHPEDWSRMDGLVKKTKHSKESVRYALQRLVKEGLVEAQAAEGSNFGRPRREWRLTR